MFGSVKVSYRFSEMHSEDTGLGNLHPIIFDDTEVTPLPQKDAVILPVC